MMIAIIIIVVIVAEWVVVLCGNAMSKEYQSFWIFFSLCFVSKMLRSLELMAWMERFFGMKNQRKKKNEHRIAVNK